MRTRVGIRTALGLLVVAGGTISAAPDVRVTQPSIRTPTCTSKFELSRTPNPSMKGNSLDGVVAFGPSDIWAVGAAGELYAVGTYRAIAEHWDGTSWTLATLPVLSGVSSLRAAAGSASDDVWAVGSNGAAHATKPLAEHWDGLTWSMVGTPNVGSSALSGVAVVSPNHAWAVGSTTQSGQPLAERWDGTAWSVVTTPVLPDGGFLTGAAAVATNDIWAVGATNSSLLLVEHWDGSIWSVVPAPDPSGGVFSLATAVSVDPGGDAWLVGSTYSAATGGDVTLAEHWDGTQWQVVSTPTKGQASLSAVFTLSATDAWAAGYETPPNGHSVTLAEHWDGLLWSTVSTPNPPGLADILLGITSDGFGTTWAVGFSGDASQDQTRTVAEDAC